MKWKPTDLTCCVTAGGSCGDGNPVNAGGRGVEVTGLPYGKRKGRDQGCHECLQWVDAVEKLFSTVGFDAVIEFGFSNSLEMKSHFAKAASEE